MAEKILSSETFEADAIVLLLQKLYEAMPRDAATKPLDANLAGAHTFTNTRHVRLVLQYDIQRDRHFGRFSVLMETPDA